MGNFLTAFLRKEKEQELNITIDEVVRALARSSADVADSIQNKEWLSLAMTVGSVAASKTPLVAMINLGAEKTVDSRFDNQLVDLLSKLKVAELNAIFDDAIVSRYPELTGTVTDTWLRIKAVCKEKLEAGQGILDALTYAIEIVNVDQDIAAAESGMSYILNSFRSIIILLAHKNDGENLLFDELGICTREEFDAVYISSGATVTKGQFAIGFILGIRILHKEDTDQIRPRVMEVLPKIIQIIKKQRT